MFFASSITVLLFTLGLLGNAVLGAENELRISSVDDLIDFSNDVNKGTSYYGTTVYLDSDIDFNSSLSSRFKSIGWSETKYFNGTFDGQGHTISNLALSSSLGHVGLFGYSKGATIKNVVLGSSCSILSTYSPDNPGIDVGSIVGQCSACTVENIINMANVTFTGTATSNNLFMGGIVGRLLASGTVRNCVNYGSVFHFGNVGNRESNIGGIVGLCGGKDGVKYVHNCANYGTITHNGTSKNLYIGGVISTSFAGTINLENCMSAGQIVNLKQASESNYVGSVVGYISSAQDPITNIVHCIWTSDVGYNDVYDPKTTRTATVSDSSPKN